jgi:hypothetical protein
LREHVDTFGVAADGRIFSSDRGHPRRLHRHQRRLGRGPESCPDPCPGCLKPGRASLRPPPCGCLARAKRGGAPPRVAERAGHSVEVLLRVYARCLDDGDDIANTRIDAALRGA